MNEAATQFASAERLGPLEIRAQSELFTSFEMRELSEALPVVFLVLNRCRQIVCANQRFAEVVGLAEPEQVYGKRPGEALGCVNALSSGAGCGTTEFCSVCGAVKSILASQNEQPSVMECVITAQGGEVLELRVRTSPIWRDGELFTVFSAVDISDENRRKSLERTFFHDISNTAAAISGTAELLMESSGPGGETEEMETVFYASQWLLDEIRSHKKLLEAEAGDLQPQLMPVSALETLSQCLGLYTRNKSTHSRRLLLSPLAEDAVVETDPVLLRRILINMFKNALEATPEGGRVDAGCTPCGDAVHFSVSNPGYIPREVQLGIFQRSFSTKGSGRGVGTYSMKLFAERYLGGTVSFTTSPDSGTTFSLFLPCRDAS
ncbi:pas domain [Desulfoluna butyratoxydans]|uniref:histidine kinase n=1 Tax=Desulfoluna butyratoxydans TaxID=231438 RepID=A0A4U8YN65_9BACT|nr:pas domain [Desulfoluna butyratoxydans]